MDNEYGIFGIYGQFGNFAMNSYYIYLRYASPSWILADGTWNDDGVWNDSAIWP